MEYNCLTEKDFSLCNRFFENGKLQLETKRNLNTKVTSKKEYDENGKIIIQEYYDENGDKITDNSIIENFNN